MGASNIDFICRNLYICIKNNMQYIYALTDTSKEVNIETMYGIIKNKPFYIGKGTYTDKKTERYNVHYYDAINYRNINPHKERTIRKLIKSNSYGIEIILEENCNLKESINEIEFNLIEFLGRKCVDKNGILTNISPGGNGGYVWKDNEKTVSNISKSNKIRWSGNKNPNHKNNRSFTETPSYKSKVSGFHWNFGKIRSYYSIYDEFLNLKGTYSCKELCSLLNIKRSTVSASSNLGKKCKGFFIKGPKNNLRISKSHIKKLLDDGIVRTTCIIQESDKYVEIGGNNLSPEKE